MAKLVAIADVPSRLVGVNRRQEERRLIQLQTSLEINRRIGSILDGETLMREISELIRANYGYDEVQVFLWDDAKPVAAPTSSCCREWGICTLPVGGGRDIGEVAFVEPPCVCARRATFQRQPGRQRSSRDAHAWQRRSGWAGKILGVLDVHSWALRRHTQADLDALQALADELGIALRNAQLYAEALSARAEAERASHLKTRLLANMSHELRAPLNVILGYSQAALSESSPYHAAMPKELMHDVHQIERSGQHLVRLIDDLLNLSLAEIGALEIVPEILDSHSLLTDNFNSMAGCRQHQSVQWRLELPMQLPELYADPLRLRQVLLNLLHNAEKNTQAGHITLRAAEKDGALQIWVEDTGRGILRAQQQQLNASLAAVGRRRRRS